MHTCMHAYRLVHITLGKMHLVSAREIRFRCIMIDPKSVATHEDIVRFARSSRLCTALGALSCI